MTTRSTISPWLDGEARDHGAPLEGVVDCDVVVIGGGYAGLRAATELGRRGRDVVLLERHAVGHGASGRNAGHLSPTIGKDLPTLVRVFRRRARDLVAFGERAVRWTEEVIADEGIACDYDPAGNMLAGVDPAHAPRLRAAADVARRLGAGITFLDDGALRERGVPAAFRCAALEEAGGHLHPGRLVRGYAERAAAAGVRIHEHTPVLAVEGDGPVVARTPAGAVRAPAAVLATNAWANELGLLPRWVVPVWVSLLRTVPLGSDQRGLLGWRGREGVYTSHEVLESFRLCADGRLLAGTRHVRHAARGGSPPPHDPAHLRRMTDVLRRRLPELGDVGVERHWQGPIAVTPDLLPAIGRRGAGLHYAVGWNGHGIAQATYAGRLLADQVTAGRRREPAIQGRRRPAWPPEPFVPVAARAVVAGLEAIDRRTDRRAARLATSR